MNYESLSLVLKSLANPNRMKIVDVLSCGSLCACDLLTQPTLSHHMKVLEKAGVVCVSKKGQWHHYSLREEFVVEFMESIQQLLVNNEDNCVCKVKEGSK